MILALDLATKIGWAKWSPKTAYAWGEFDIDESQLGRFATTASRWLAGALHDVTEVYIEEMFVYKQIDLSVITKLAGLRFEVARACTQRNISCETVAISKWRSHFLGDTRAPSGLTKSQARDWLKKRCIETCRARGWNVRTDNQADALGILDWAKCRSQHDFAVQSTPLFAGIS